MEAFASSTFQDELAQLEATFNRALATIRMHFQPIVDAHTRGVLGYEALMRPNDPVLSNPGAMLDAADRLHRQEELGRVCREQVYLQARQCDRNALIFVNVNAEELDDPSLFTLDAGLASMRERVVLEVTERQSLARAVDIRQRVGELRALGYSIAIDDLGAGHARMTQLSTVDTDFVKLDMSLVRNIHEFPLKQQLVSSIIELCHQSATRVIGEGVEREAELETLVSAGCDLLQGYLIARPAPEFQRP
jgi:EAL domain-containing protein (putative c-di-GMP-specific phosphodiesterase class I)